jgi:hypothetical protein
MDAIENVPSNAKLQGVLPRGYALPALNKVMLGELIDLFSDIGMQDETGRAICSVKLTTVCRRSRPTSEAASS